MVQNDPSPSSGKSFEAGFSIVVVTVCLHRDLPAALAFVVGAVFHSFLSSPVAPVLNRIAAM
ncbi:hypothetical protein C8J56DRAFT_1063250 [Mycena floridula]|nr:hypothetical protein C8J56DRAFT_1063250 [Mycena floridula]